METREISQLRVNPNNPRGEVVVDDSLRELAASIQSQGVLQPILITPDGTIVCGHRRVKACELAAVRTIPVVMRNLTEQQQLQVMLIENLQREDLTTLQTAKAYRILIDHGLSITQIAKATGFRSESISRHLDILQLHPDLHSHFDGDQCLSLGAIFYLLPLPPEEQLRVGNMARERGWTLSGIAREVGPKSIIQHPKSDAHAEPPKSSDFTLKSVCPTERKAHLEYAIKAVGQLLSSAPDEVFATRYKRWITIMEDDLVDEEAKEIKTTTFRGSVDAFQRQPKERTRSRISV